MQLLSETMKIQVPVEVAGQTFVVFVTSDSRKGVFMWYPIEMWSFGPTTFRLDVKSIRPMKCNTLQHGKNAYQRCYFT